MRTSGVALLIGAAMTVSCSTGERNPEAPTALFDVVDVSEVFKVKRQVELMPDPDDPVGKVAGAAWAPDGRIVIADAFAKNLKIFSPEGTLLQTIGGAGEGPGEFMNPSAVLFLPQSDTILVFDQRLSRITVFTPSGEVARTHALPSVILFGSLKVMGSDSLVLSGLLRDELDPGRPTYILHVMDREGNVARSFWERPVPGSTLEGSAMIPAFALREDDVPAAVVFRAGPVVYEAPGKPTVLGNIPFTPWDEGEGLSSPEFAAWSGSSWHAPMALFTHRDHHVVYSKTGEARRGSDRHFLTVYRSGFAAGVHTEVSRVDVPFDQRDGEFLMVGLDERGFPIAKVVEIGEVTSDHETLLRDVIQ